MRFSLRSLALLVALFAIGLGIYSRERRMKTPRIIAVLYQSDQKVIAYHNPRRAKAIRKSSDEKHLAIPAARRRLALTLAADVTILPMAGAYDDRGEEKWHVVREHPEMFLPLLEDLLSTQSSMEELGTGGMIALTLQDSASIERANKEVVRRLGQTPKECWEMMIFLEAQKEDLQSIAGLAEVIPPFLNVDAYKGTASDFMYRLGAPESEMRKKLEEIRRAKPSPTGRYPSRSDRPDHYRLGWALHRLTHSPLVREEVVGDAFISLVANSSPPGYPACVTRHIFENDDLPWKERAISELCKHPKRERYYKIVCEFGGADQADYYVARLTDTKDPKLALDALTRIWDPGRAADALKEQFSGNPFALLPLLTEAIGDDAAPLILAAIDAEDPERRLDAADVAGFFVQHDLCCNSKQILERLEKAFHDGLSNRDYLESRQLLNDMCRLGFQRPDELAAKLPPYSEPDAPTASSHWIVNDITCRDFADYLDQLEIGPAVDVDLLLDRYEYFKRRDGDDWTKRISPDWFARQALVQIGVATGLGPTLLEPDKTLLVLSSITQGDLAPIGAVSDPEDDHLVRMSWNKIAFEIDLVTGYQYPAYQFVDAMDAIVDKYVDGEKRFVVYDYPHVSNVAYLDEPVIQVLSERFGLAPWPVKRFDRKPDR